MHVHVCVFVYIHIYIYIVCIHVCACGCRLTRRSLWHVKGKLPQRAYIIAPTRKHGLHLALHSSLRHPNPRRNRLPGSVLAKFQPGIYYAPCGFDSRIRWFDMEWLVILLGLRWAFHREWFDRIGNDIKPEEKYLKDGFMKRLRFKTGFIILVGRLYKTFSPGKR